jgi:hypothetical protein
MQLDKRLAARLAENGQDHLLKFFDELDNDAQQTLTAELSALDLGLLQELIQTCVLKKPVLEIPSDIKPAPFFPAAPFRRTCRL